MRGFLLSTAKVALAPVVSKEENSNDWIRVALLLGEISWSMAWKTKKLVSRMFIHDRHILKGKRS